MRTVQLPATQIRRLGTEGFVAAFLLDSLDAVILTTVAGMGAGFARVEHSVRKAFQHEEIIHLEEK